MLELKLSDGSTLAVPESLQSITTYVLLEQERWFEKEMDFIQRWLRPGVTVIDIGANLGVYSIPMARLVGPTGRVFAYEPGSEARLHLERSRELNAAGNLVISSFALSDCDRQGLLVFGGSSELNALGDGGLGESVRITSLDSEAAAQHWTSPEFVKIDAEGEEQRILAGGHEFFAQHSPLVMFEVKAGDKANEQLRTVFAEIGFRLFRQLGGEPILVAHDLHQPLDKSELNLFAAKPDRVRAMAEQGFLVDDIPAWLPGTGDYEVAERVWQAQKFSSAINLPDGNGSHTDSEYAESLAAYGVWRATDQPVAMRVAALAGALNGARAVCARAPTAERLSSLARFAWEWGARAESVAVLQRLLEITQNQQIRFSEPFWPAHPRFDDVDPVSGWENWFLSAAAEQYERSFSFSSRFAGASGVLEWLCAQPLASTEMERRRFLVKSRAGEQPTISEQLRGPHADHLNSEIWRAGKIPGTIVGSLMPNGSTTPRRNEPCPCGSGKRYKHCCGAHV